MSPETTAPIDGPRRRIRIPVWAFLLAVAVIITGLLLILLYRKHSGLSAQMTSYSITIPPGDRNRFSCLTVEKSGSTPRAGLNMKHIRKATMPK